MATDTQGIATPMLILGADAEETASANLLPAAE